MDRNKVKKISKNKPLPGLVALGSSGAPPSAPNSASSTPAGVSSKVNPLKRDLSPGKANVSSINKKPIIATSGPPPLPTSRVASTAAATSAAVASATTRNTSSPQTIRDSSENWNELAIEVMPRFLVSAITTAENSSDNERIESLLCGAVKQLKTCRTSVWKPAVDQTLIMSLLYLSKTKPQFFRFENVVEAFCSLLKKDPNSYKTKNNKVVTVLSANVLLASFRTDFSWPDSIFDVFLEDILGERIWVDNEECKGFVENILAEYATRMPDKSAISLECISDFIRCASSIYLQPPESLLKSLSKLIIERPILFSGLMKNSQLREKFLQHTGDIFLKYFKSKFMQSFPSGVAIPDGTVLLRWSDKAMILDLGICHAFLVYISQVFKADSDQPPEVPAYNVPLYQSLFDIWFEPFPQSSQESVIFNDSTRLCLLRSAYSPLISLGLKSADINQLLTFAQSFGLSVDALNQIFSTLDQEKTIDEETWRSCVVNPIMFERILEGYWIKGVRTGTKFASRMGLRCSISDVESYMNGADRRETSAVQRPGCSATNTEQLQMRQVFDPTASLQKQLESWLKLTPTARASLFNQLWMELLRELNDRGRKSEKLLNAFVTSVGKLLKSDSKFVSQCLNGGELNNLLGGLARFGVRNLHLKIICRLQSLSAEISAHPNLNNETLRFILNIFVNCPLN